MTNVLIRVGGIVESLAMSLPMPWDLRMRIASVLGRLIGWALHHSPSIYRFAIDSNRRFGMGKQEHGEMQSVHALNRVLREFDKDRIAHARIKEAILRAERERISHVELPRFLSSQILGRERTDRLFSSYPGY